MMGSLVSRATWTKCWKSLPAKAYCSKEPPAAKRPLPLSARSCQVNASLVELPQCRHDLQLPRGKFYRKFDNSDVLVVINGWRFPVVPTGKSRQSGADLHTDNPLQRCFIDFASRNGVTIAV